MEPEIRSERKKLLHTLERFLEGPMILLGFVWLALLVVELVWGLSPILEIVSLAIWGLFILDFLLKFTLAPHKLHYLRTNWLTAVSLLIPAIRVFRVLRLFKIFRGVRIIRVVSSLNRTMKSL
ncbi:MAG: ion transporter, partial [Bacteroidota bacterium]|nr:ion transporter [Bacteroidota bacterium]